MYYTLRLEGKALPKRVLVIAVIFVLFVGGISCRKSEPETMLPSITYVSVSDITYTTARVTWTTDEPATSQVEYGETTDYGLSTPLDEDRVTSHNVMLSGLEPDTTYHFRVNSKDALGNLAISDDYTFSTLGRAAMLEEISAKVAGLRELDPLGEVEPQFITRDELRGRMLEFFEDYTPEEAAIDQEVFVLLDLMEEEQDLYTILWDLYCEQIIGFYDYESKELCVVSDKETLGPLEKMTLVHEYTHALQDQHFDLESLPEEEDNSDLSMAVDSLVSGDATLVESTYIWTVLDGSEREALFRESQELRGEKFEAAPRFIKENLLFPYDSGLKFVLALHEQGGWQAINQAYSDPPRSTEQILHPKKYLEQDEPQPITMPDLQSALGAGWSQLDSDVLGELNIRIYLETFIDTSKATIAAEGWDGDRCLFLKDTQGRKLLVLYSTWDSLADAQEFFDAYITFVQNKSGGGWTPQIEEGSRWWETEGLSLYLGQEGSDALIIIAPDETTTEAVLAEFPKF